MKILEYTGLDTSRVKSSYRKVSEAIARHDFRAAQVKKLANLSQGKFYRAKLDDADRLLFSLVRHGDEVCALMLEVIANHDYDKSRFLRGAAIDESKIPDIGADEAIKEAQGLRYLHPERTAIHLLDKPISFDDTQETIYRQPPPLVVVGSAGSGKTALTQEGADQLTRILREIRENHVIHIAGHTDDIGGDRFNERLARRRAEFVATWLKRQGVRIPMEIEARGKCCYLAPNDTDDGRAANRRVEVVLRERQSDLASNKSSTTKKEIVR